MNLPQGSRRPINLPLALERIRRLEARALRQMEELTMDNPGIATPIDAAKVERIRELGRQGLSIAEVARQASVGRTTARKYLGRNGHQAENANNGQKPCTLSTVSSFAANHSAGLAEVERLLNDRWQKLSLAERLQFLLRA